MLAPVAVEPASWVGLDPRTKIVLVALVSTVVMNPSGLTFAPGGLALGIALAAYEGAWRRGIGLLVTAVLMWLLVWFVPVWWPSPVAFSISVGCAYLLRFIVVFGIGMHLIATTSPTQLSAGLRAWRVPRPISVTLSVMVRFFPVVASEASAVLDAMRLRGLTGTSGFLRHPILSMERFTVPMIAASLRASEDLSASAILRGLGSFRVPTAMHPPRLGMPDAMLVLVVPVLALASYWATPFLTGVA